MLWEPTFSSFGVTQQHTERPTCRTPIKTLQPRSALRLHFDNIATDRSAMFKKMRFRCRYCKTTIFKASKNMSTHTVNCLSVPPSIGRLSPAITHALSPNAGTEVSLQNNSAVSFVSSVTGPLTHFQHDSISTETKINIDV